MELANFFDKLALGASQILKHYDYESFKATLTRHCVGIIYDRESAQSFEGRIAIELSVNLFARLYPQVSFVSLNGNSDDYSAELRKMAMRINPKITIHGTLEKTTECVVVGTHFLDSKKVTVYVGSNGWRAILSSNSPRGSGKSDNPFGAAAAACFGAANIFRRIFHDQLDDARIDGEINLSLLNYDSKDLNKQDLSLDNLNLGETFLVGLGAIGNATVWVMSKLRSLTGMLHLIDPERIELSNLQRYILTRQEDVDRIKVEVAAEAFSQSDLEVITHAQTWEKFLNERNNWFLPVVAVGVDSAHERRNIQASLPKWIANAWTQEGDLGVSRHSFVGKSACLACLYLPESGLPNQDQQVAAALNLPEALKEIRSLLYNNQPIGNEFLHRISVALNIPMQLIIEFANLPLSRFYSEAVCGGIVLKLTKGNGKSVRIAVPMDFQSTLAGVMLAAELAKHALDSSLSDEGYTTKIDLLRPLAEYLNIPVSKHSSGNCICQDDDYLEAYDYKYR